MTWQVRAGTSVRYRDAGNRIHHATVTTVTNQTTIDLRHGHGSTPITAVPRVTETADGVGWFRHGVELTVTVTP